MIEQQTTMGMLYRCESCHYNTLNPDYAAAHGRIHPPSAALDSASPDEPALAGEPVETEPAGGEPVASEEPVKSPTKRRKKES